MDFPDPDEEFELMHAEEMEMLKELEESQSVPEEGNCRKSRRSLDFTSPIQNGGSSNLSQQSVAPLPQSQSSQSSSAGWAQPSQSSQLHPVNQQTEKKRKVQELFGDITDIDFEEPKRRKGVTLETDEELIRRIKEQRQLLKQARHRLTDFRTLNASTPYSGITSRVPSYPFVPVTLSNGERMYARLRSEQYFEQEVSDIKAQSRSMGLLSVPYQTVWQEAQEYILRRTEIVEEEKETTNDSGCDTISEDDSGTADLWVEMYKPRSYVELLSDEGANRTLLLWLKLWDKVVFNREKIVKQKPKDESKKENKFTSKSTLNTDLDEHGCPKQKVALLCGPPGLGKTTLAHMVGAHAGYNVIEVNASDDRSPELFRTQLEAATRMNSLMGAEPRPNCLVLDEIDGAPVGSIDVLIKFIMGKGTKPKKKVKGKEASGGGGTGMKRPVICICNDMYVPALRALRQIALIVHFPPTASSRLAQRLMEIARKQKIRTDMGALLALAEKSSNDIRSCLSVLHFFKSQKKDVRLVDIQRNNIGQKDVQKGLFTVWQEIFHTRSKKTMSGMSSNGQLLPMPDLNTPNMKFEMKPASRMDSVVRTVQCCGDYDRLMQGVFENFLKLAKKDSRLQSVCLGLEWFCNFDIISHKIRSTQHYVLMPYQPFSFAMWHLLFSTTTWPKVSYPNQGYEVYLKEQKCKQILKDLMQGMTPLVRAHVNSSPLLYDTLSPLLQIMIPTLRPVNTQLYSKRETEELNNVVSIMIDYNLNYIQERTQEGGYEYKLDPNIEEIALFPGSKPIRNLGYAGKQLIAREVELEKLRRTERENKSSTSTSSTDVSTNKSSTSTSSTDVSTNKSKPAAMPDQTLKPKAVVEMQCKDFFGRVVQPVPGSSSTARKEKTDEIVKSDIWYHYQEGFSNAVRRSLKMKELLEPRM